mmetsp:Transcript_8872/g.23289  ORF Transcript_8872/g.23289 Transcript_8872/m.23289 type:complete len:182 (-) Transcript_8872:8-553(-)
MERRMSAVSTAALACSSLVICYPVLGVRQLLNPCNMATVVDISPTECEASLLQWRAGASESSEATLLLYALTLAVRLEGAFFTALLLSTVFALSQPFRARSSQHLFLAVFFTLALLVHLSHYGMVPFGVNSAAIAAKKPDLMRGLTAFSAVQSVVMWICFAASVNASSERRRVRISPTKTS